jgi:hypothetical protein
VTSPLRGPQNSEGGGFAAADSLRRAGEMQYSLRQEPDSHLTLRTVIVRAIEYQHSAITQTVPPGRQEISYLLTAETDAIQLEMTTRWALTATAREPETVRTQMTEHLRSATSAYKAAIERSQRSP